MAATNADCHRLIYCPQAAGLSETGTGQSFALLQSESHRLPFGWLYLFGSRNIWEPGESVTDRGGAAADRDPHITPMDTALVRLKEASQALRSDRQSKELCAPLDILSRFLEAQGERGQIRWTVPLGGLGAHKDPAKARQYFLETIARAENLIFYLAAGKRDTIQAILADLRQRCDFAPGPNLAEDLAELRKRLRKRGGDCPLEEYVIRIMIGWPIQPDRQANFQEQAGKLMANLSREAQKLPSAPAKPAKPWWRFWK